jgi:tetratricopeptide (TPR) repeat protein
MAASPRNEALRALVAEFGLTEDGLAEEVNQRSHELFGKYGNATGRLVRLWLSGQVRWPTPYHLLPLEDIFGVPALELGFVPRGKCSLTMLATIRRRVDDAGAQQGGTGPGSSSTGQESSVLRREFFIAAGVLLDIGVKPLPAAGRITMADVATVRDTTRKLHVQGDLHGCAGLADVAERYIAHAQDSMKQRTCGPRAETAMHEAIAELAASGGWCCHDAGDFPRARRFFETALALADLAGSHTLKARAWSNMSSVAVDLGGGSDAVTMARQALEVTRRIADPRLSAFLHCRVARAYACQRESGQASRALMLAETALDKASGDAPPWLAYFCPAEILNQAARSRHALGHLREAERLGQQSLASWPAPQQRRRFVSTVNLAQIQLDAGYLDEVATTGSQALDMLPTVHSALATGKLAHVRRRLEPYRADSQVAAFIHRFDASPANSAS